MVARLFDRISPNCLQEEIWHEHQPGNSRIPNSDEYGRGSARPPSAAGGVGRKRGLGILADLGSVWEKSNLTTRQQLQGFIFPEGVTARKEGFGTDPIALCLRAEKLPSPAITDVVGPPGFEPRTKWL